MNVDQGLLSVATEYRGPINYQYYFGAPNFFRITIYHQSPILIINHPAIM